MYSRQTLREGARPDEVRDILGHANIDVTQNVYDKSWREERVDAFAAKRTRQPSPGRSSKRGPPAQTSAAGQFPITDRLNRTTYQASLILWLLEPSC